MRIRLIDYLVGDPEHLDRLRDRLRFLAGTGQDTVPVEIPDSNAVVKVWSWRFGHIPDSELRYVADLEASCEYLSLSAPGADEEALLKSVTHGLPRIPVATLLKDVRENGDDDTQTYIRLALGISDTCDRKAKDVILKSLQSDVTERRRGAALAVGFLLWPEFLDPALAALNRETDEINKAVLTFACREMGQT